MAPRSTTRRSVPGRSISGFRTGPLGLGHVVLTGRSTSTPVLPFYVDVLGFGLSDYIAQPFRAYFFHVNARHHTLALIETGTNGTASPYGGAVFARRCRPVL